ncbi:CWC16 protein [Aspergillus floccosus]
MQGFNMGRYVPPDQEGLTTGNKLAGKHPLGARARHLHTTGALIVRFEMPFAVWCTTCKPHETLVGQGVRFNAEKKKVGNYYSTPIYSFRMRHPPCGGWIEIRTDPQNTAYIVTEGGRKRDTGDSKELGVGEIAIKLPGEAKDTADAFARLEGKVEDKKRTETEQSRILDLKERQQRDWQDPYEKSRLLRRTFRAERKVLESEEAKREALKDKLSLGIELVDETEEDRLRAGIVDFKTGLDTSATRTRPMFEAKASSSSMKGTSGSNENGKKGKKVKSADLMAERKAKLRSELAGNTRAAIDPFLSHEGDIWQPVSKRRKTGPNKGTDAKEDTDGDTPAESDSPGTTTLNESSTEPVPNSSAPTPTALVAYGSDSD